MSALTLFGKRAATCAAKVVPNEAPKETIGSPSC